MRSAPILFAALVAAVTGPALASQTPKPGLADRRVSTIDYDPLQVVRIQGVFRTATQILFGDDEAILHVAVGDTTAWDVAAEKNILFIKPKAAHGATNLIVTTEHRGQTRNYTFELTTKSGKGGSAGLYVLRFRYPSDEASISRTVLSATELALRARLTALQLERGAVEGKRNLAYSVQGSAAVEPSEVSDNGRFTLMRFPAGQAIPAIYQVTSDGAESLASFDVRGEFVVVHAISGQFRLRRGAEVLCIYNEAPDPYGVNLGTHTASPIIDRTDLSARTTGRAIESPP